MLHLDDATIARLVDLASVRAAVASAFAAWGRGDAATTQRVRAAVGEGMASAMAAVVPPFSGGKLYATRHGRFTFVIVLFDVEGHLLATLDGDVLTQLRTPAASALAIEWLAAPGVTTAALLGTGRQAWPHLQMLAAECPGLRDVRVYGRSTKAAGTLAARAERELGLAARPVADAPRAVDGAEIVVSVTSSSSPLFDASVLGDRTLICAVGATKPNRRELGPDVVERCRAVVCDDVQGSQVECGDLIQAAAASRFDWSRAIELSALACGAVEVPRAGDGPVLFETQGVALQDVAAAGLVWRRYHQQAEEVP